ncbi:unnamed protein product, partial [marine sediment metagenome]
MAELTLEQALETATEWTSDEIDWIYSVGGSVAGDVEAAVDDSLGRAEGIGADIRDMAADYIAETTEHVWAAYGNINEEV